MFLIDYRFQHRAGGWPCNSSCEYDLCRSNSRSGFRSDARHGTNGTLDDIDLYLEWNGIPIDASAGTDNKERIYYDDVDAGDYQLAIHGWDVTADNAGCGNNKMRVYYAWYAEDFDRESSENLNDIETM